MDKSKWNRVCKEGCIAGIGLLMFALGCGYLLKYTVDSPAAVTALTSRATR